MLHSPRSVVSAPFCGLVLLVSLLHVSPAFAQSGSNYGPPTYGGSGTYDPGGGPPTGPPVKPFSTNGGVSGFGGQAAAGGTATEYAKGGITTAFTWTGIDPVPQSVIVTQTCVASWSSSFCGSAVTGTCDNGLKGPQSTTGPTYYSQHGYDATGVCGQDSSGKAVPAYSVVAGAATLNLPTLNVNSSITGNTAAGPLIASVSYTAAVSPVTIAISGTLDPTHGDCRALTGQQIMATLNGIPSGVKITSYVWSFTGGTNGNPIKAWQGSGTSADGKAFQQLVPLTDADKKATDTTGNGISVKPIDFYDQSPDQNLVVACAVNLTFPDGTTGSATAVSPAIMFMKPTVTWVLNKSFNNLTPGFMPHLGQAFGANELWGPMTITEPPALVPNGSGTGCVVQVASPLGRGFAGTDQNGSTVTYAKIQYVNGDGTTGTSTSPTGLDGGFPYPFGYTANADGTFTPVSSAYTWKANVKGYAADGPKQNFTPANPGTTIKWFSSTANDSFNTWVMYCPPANGLGTIYVPLQTLTWSWGGNASLTGTAWSVSEGPAFVPGSPGDAPMPPSWSLKIPPGLVIGP